MRNRNRTPLQAWGLMSAIVSQLVGSILIGIFLGKWIDSQFHTFPLFLVIGLLLGLTIGVYGTIRLVNHFSEEDGEETND